MKRATLHFVFAILAAIFLFVVLWQFYQLHNNRHLISSIQNVPAIISEDPAALSETNKFASEQNSKADSHPAVLLSTASALSAGGQFEQAESILVKLIDQHQSKPTGQAARYNLANHYLRQGMRAELPGAQTRPLVELAKQRYRDLLLIDPQNWNARHNLEVALRVAPEITARTKDKGPPIKSVDVIVPDFKLKDLP